MSAKPLNVSSATTKPATPTATSKAAAKSVNATPTQSTPSVVTKAEDISSPHELTAFVEDLLTKLEARFEDMSTQVLDRMMQMSSRVDALESSIQDLINDTYVPSTPQLQSAAAGTPLEKVDE